MHFVLPVCGRRTATEGEARRVSICVCGGADGAPLLCVHKRQKNRGSRESRRAWSVNWFIHTSTTCLARMTTNRGAFSSPVPSLPLPALPAYTQQPPPSHIRTAGRAPVHVQPLKHLEAPASAGVEGKGITAAAVLSISMDMVVGSWNAFSLQRGRDGQRLLRNEAVEHGERGLGLIHGHLHETAAPDRH